MHDAAPFASIFKGAYVCVGIVCEIIFCVLYAGRARDFFEVMYKFSVCTRQDPCDGAPAATKATQKEEKEKKRKESGKQNTGFFGRSLF
jgi:hypothetical protein